MNLKAKSAGRWIDVATFGENAQLDVMQAASALLRALQEPKAAMRIEDGKSTRLECGGPHFRWAAPREM